MNIHSLFALLGPNFANIVVSGCQRCGTNIASKMIAHSTGFEHVPETEIGIRDRDLYRKRLRGKKQVLHAPGMSYQLGGFPGDDEVLFIWMERDRHEIVQSMKRIKWVGAKDELRLGGWSQESPTPLLDVVTMKAQQRDHYLKHQKLTFLTFHYRQLDGHPLWVEDALRGGWTERQTSDSFTSKP